MERMVEIVQRDDGILYSRNEKIGKKTDLVFDSETKVVYHMFEKAHCSSAPVNYSGFIAPYISENGKFCRFIDNKIVEIG